MRYTITLNDLERFANLADNVDAGGLRVHEDGKLEFLETHEGEADLQHNGADVEDPREWLELVIFYHLRDEYERWPKVKVEVVDDEGNPVDVSTLEPLDYIKYEDLEEEMKGRNNAEEFLWELLREGWSTPEGIQLVDDIGDCYRSNFEHMFVRHFSIEPSEEFAQKYGLK